MNASLRALIVASSAEDAEALSNELRRAGYDLVSAHVSTRDSMDEALQSESWDVILSDDSTPNFGALAALALLKERQHDIPFLVVSDRVDAETAISALRAGANDFIPKDSLDRLASSVERELDEARMRRGVLQGKKTLRESEARLREALLGYAHRFRAIAEVSKGLIYEWDLKSGTVDWFASIDEKLGYADGEFPRTRQGWEGILHPEDRDRVLAAAERHIRTAEPFSTEYRAIRRDGTVMAWNESAKVLREEGNPTRWIGFITDVTENRQVEEQVKYLALHDVLTDLPNRALFNDRLALALPQSKRGNQKLAVLILNLDRFQAVNESFGQSVGDRFLCRVAERIRACTRAGDTVARLGGDEFAILIHRLRSEEDVARVAQKVLEAIRLPFLVDQRELFTTASMGASTFPTDGTDADTLTRNADTALHRAKAHGRDNYQLYSPDMNARAIERLSLENHLRQAVTHEQLVLYYQPVIDLRSERILGVEALLRWLHPERGLLPASEFIPLAEVSGLISPIGEWILHAACEQLREWNDAGYSDLRMAVNVSPRQFQQPDFVAQVTRAIAASGISPESLDLEITETSAMEDPERSIAKLQDLKKRNVRISLDDFGTGFASLNYLGRFPIDRIKLDHSFVRELPGNRHNCAIAVAVITMAHALTMSVVGEGVETAEQVAFLRDEGCDEAQGYLFSHPLPASECRALLDRKSGARPQG
jgi:diguanylate cyclase (GGDEF)-like protein/PAS domain S-box-containing protein